MSDDAKRVLIARYHANQGAGDVVQGALERMAEAVRTNEPGCLVYHAARSMDDPDVFFLYEEYVDERALLAHRETPHFQEFIETTIVPLLRSRERHICLPVGG